MRKSIAYRIERLREIEAYFLNRLLYSAQAPRRAEESAHYAQRAMTARIMRRVLANQEPLATNYNLSSLMRHFQECGAENEAWKTIKGIGAA